MIVRSDGTPRSAAASAAATAPVTAPGSTTSPPAMASAASAVSPRPTTRSRPPSARATTARTTPAASSIPATRGPPPVSRARSLATAVQTLPNHCPCRRHGLAEARGRSAPGRGAFRPAAAPRPEDVLHLFDDGVGADLRCDVLGHRLEPPDPSADGLLLRK